jgi:hypothetical protein
MKKIITIEQIETIKKLLLDRNNYQDIKEILDDLDDSKIDLMIKDLKDFLRNKGKSTILDSDIQNIINKYGES